MEIVSIRFALKNESIHFYDGDNSQDSLGLKTICRSRFDDLKEHLDAFDLFKCIVRIVNGNQTRLWLLDHMHHVYFSTAHKCLKTTWKKWKFIT